MVKAKAKSHVRVEVQVSETEKVASFKHFDFQFLSSNLRLVSSDNRKLWYWRSPNGTTYIRVQTVLPKADVGVVDEVIYSGRVRAGQRVYSPWPNYGFDFTEQLEALLNLELITLEEYRFSSAKANALEQAREAANELDEFTRMAKKVGLELTKPQIKALDKKFGNAVALRTTKGGL